ncbi:hypothetical protein BJV74DRAFT_799131 [Russula compacta]|nr:hypothetical protein BJV74DRAFT_799131 [Russula compacta]
MGYEVGASGNTVVISWGQETGRAAFAQLYYRATFVIGMTIRRERFEHARAECRCEGTWEQEYQTRVDGLDARRAEGGTERNEGNADGLHILNIRMNARRGGKKMDFVRYTVASENNAGEVDCYLWAERREALSACPRSFVRAREGGDRTELETRRKKGWREKKKKRDEHSEVEEESQRLREISSCGEEKLKRSERRGPSQRQRSKSYLDQNKKGDLSHAAQPTNNLELNLELNFSCASCALYPPSLKVEERAVFQEHAARSFPLPRLKLCRRRRNITSGAECINIINKQNTALRPPGLGQSLARLRLLDIWEKMGGNNRVASEWNNRKRYGWSSQANIFMVTVKMDEKSSSNPSSCRAGKFVCFTERVAEACNWARKKKPTKQTPTSSPSWPLRIRCGGRETPRRMDAVSAWRSGRYASFSRRYTTVTVGAQTLDRLFLRHDGGPFHPDLTRAGVAEVLILERMKTPLVAAGKWDMLNSQLAYRNDSTDADFVVIAHI